jgi:glycosyltransferase involved in cell wall biosynthesis
MCRSLAADGHEVHIIAEMEKTLDKTIVDGVHLHRAEPFDSRIKRMLRKTPSVLAMARTIEADVYHFHDPEFLIYIGKFGKIVKKPVVYDVHEDYAAAILSKYWLYKPIRSLVSRMFSYIEKKKVKKIFGLVVAWPKLLEKYVGHPRVALINNFPYQNELSCSSGQKNERINGKFIYVGGLTRIRSIMEMIRAIALAGKSYQLVLGGPWGSEQYKDECMSEPGWSQCKYLGYMSRAEMSAQFSTVQAGLVLFYPEPNHMYSVPNKIFEYMSAGLPVIASDLPMQRSIIEETDCGVIADARSPEDICVKMQWIAGHPAEATSLGEKGILYIQKKYNWELEYNKLLDFYIQIVQTYEQL